MQQAPSGTRLPPRGALRCAQSCRRAGRRAGQAATVCGAGHGGMGGCVRIAPAAFGLIGEGCDGCSTWYCSRRACVELDCLVPAPAAQAPLAAGAGRFHHAGPPLCGAAVSSNECMFPLGVWGPAPAIGHLSPCPRPLAGLSFIRRHATAAQQRLQWCSLDTVPRGHTSHSFAPRPPHTGYMLLLDEACANGRQN